MIDEQPSLAAALWRFKYLIVAVAVLAGLAAYLLASRSPAVYRAEGLVLLTDPRSGSTPATELSVFWNPTRYLRNQVAVMQSPVVLDRAATILGPGYTADDVEDAVSVEAETDLDALTVAATSQDPDEPIEMVDAVVEAYGEVVSEQVQANAAETVEGLESSKAALAVRLSELDLLLAEDPDNTALIAERESTGESLQDVDGRMKSITTNALLYGTGIQLYIAPTPPTTQIAPAPARNAMIAFLLGALGAGAFAWWRAERDQRADTKEAPAGVLGAPLLAAIPDFGNAGTWEPAPTLSHPDSTASESYHFALSSLMFVLDQMGGSSVIITSTSPGDGKTVTALNICIAAMTDGTLPLLIDGDERVQGLTKLSGADTPSPNGAVGNHYRWQITPDESIDFIGAGRNLGTDISGHFRSVPFRQSLHQAIEGRSLVVIDTPPVMSAAETAEIASEVDGIVLVVVKGTPMRKLIDARDRLELSGTPIIGYIFNKADVRSEQYYTYPNRTSVPS